MPLTLEDAMNCSQFHEGECTKRVGPRGGIRVMRKVWHRRGPTETWIEGLAVKFRIPVKHFGRYGGSAWIHHKDRLDFHAPIDCPVRKEEF